MLEALHAEEAERARDALAAVRTCLMKVRRTGAGVSVLALPFSRARVGLAVLVQIHAVQTGSAIRVGVVSIRAGARAGCFIAIASVAVQSLGASRVFRIARLAGALAGHGVASLVGGTHDRVSALRICCEARVAVASPCRIVAQAVAIAVFECLAVVSRETAITVTQTCLTIALTMATAVLDLPACLPRIADVAFALIGVRVAGTVRAAV